jgi:type II secretory pathway pseudopilin PulG
MHDRLPIDPSGGFTLIKLIAIIALLMGLVLPSVQSARELSQRAHWQGNQKQQGQALNMSVTMGDAYRIGYIAWPNLRGGAVLGVVGSRPYLIGANRDLRLIRIEC